MNEFWIIVGLVFGATLLGVQAIYGPIARSRHAAKSTDRRLAQSAEQSGRSEVVNALRNQRGIAEFSSPLLRRINDLITQSGLQVNSQHAHIYNVGWECRFICYLGARFRSRHRFGLSRHCIYVAYHVCILS